MNDFLMILFKTGVFLFSYMLISREVFKFFKKRNPSAERWDVEIIVVSVISAVLITSVVKHVFKLFI